MNDCCCVCGKMLNTMELAPPYFCWNCGLRIISEGGSLAKTKVMKCSCEHQGQDRMYGKGNRLFNVTIKGKQGPEVYRCTICGKERS